MHKYVNTACRICFLLLLLLLIYMVSAYVELFSGHTLFLVWG